MSTISGEFQISARVSAGRDEVEPMSYNNRIVSARTDEEFAEQARLMVTNDAGSGLASLLEAWKPVLPPQECMYTPSFLSLYPAVGMPTISLCCSVVPFNAFSTFVPLLGVAQRYNPLTFTSARCPGSMTLLPAYNHSNVADHWLSLRRWVVALRRRQLREESPLDLLLLIDADAEDDFWADVAVPLATRAFRSIDGLHRIVRSVASLAFVRFTRPSQYLETHPPMGSVVLDQDAASGCFDGLSSWAEKWEDTRLWTLLQRGRDLSDYARELVTDPGVTTGASSDDRRLARSLQERLLAMSTIHFGLATPIMNGGRLEDGLARAR